MRNALTTGYRREGLRETPRFLRCPSQEGHRRSQHALEGKTMKTVTLYEIREYQYEGAGYSKVMSSKLRDRKAATKLVKRLKKMGHKRVFASPMKVAA
ncbi:hypothetical protein ACEPW6_21875 [Pseudomonas aeruginosa]|uniref:hypothetical protein n=3 Tax=Pseudomonas TaxID=286 RepID=UPI0024981436|nr:hypothetical protein [Pseudomonas aeruginosa]MDI2402340.1 hypothetical protein [Pseudomonas aeruginosa]